MKSHIRNCIKCGKRIKDAFKYCSNCETSIRRKEEIYQESFLSSNIKSLGEMY